MEDTVAPKLEESHTLMLRSDPLLCNSRARQSFGPLWKVLAFVLLLWT